MIFPSRPQSSLVLMFGLLALAGCSPSPSVSEVRFSVTLPPETPADATLRIQGEQPEFSSQPLVHEEGTTYSTQVRLPRDQAISFRVWSSTPGARELDAAGAAALHTFTPHADAEPVQVSVERWGDPSAAGKPQTVFIVEAPASTPKEDSVWLSGNQPELGSWGGGDVKLYPAINGRHAGTLSFTPGTSLEFKVTRGSWEKVEKGAQGEEVDNHTLETGGGYERIFISVQSWADIMPAPPPVLTGNIKYHRDVSPRTGGLKKRDLIVWLPPDYTSNPTRRYPVLYMHDGQNLMDASTGFAGEWSVDETAQELVTKGQVEPLIIVGVYNTADRVDEYTQVPFAPEYPNAGKADAYGDFLIQDVKPLIDREYRTRIGAADTGLAGSSLGGLVSMYLGLKHPDTFTRLGVISPSVWWANKDIVAKVKALPGALPLRIWEDIGTDEGSGSQAETVADAAELRDALRSKGWTDENLKYTVVPGAKHNEKAWAARFGETLRFLFPPVP